MPARSSAAAPAVARKRARTPPKQKLPATPGVCRIVLHGRLKKEFGGPFDWGVSTPGEAIYALTKMKPGFRESMERGSFRVIRGELASGQHIDETMLAIGFGKTREFHIVPVAAGRAKGNAGNIIKIVVGVVLIAAAVATGFGAIGATATAAAGGGAAAGGLFGTGFLAGSTLFGISAGAMGLFGVGLVLGGVGDILSHQPKAPASNASFLLNGPTNTAAQGGPIPVNYGTKVRVGSTVISCSYIAAAFSTAGIPPTTAENGGAIDLLGGG